MTSEIWRAIHIAEQAVNQSWRNSDISEQTAKAFSQLIQRSAREVICKVIMLSLKYINR